MIFTDSQAKPPTIPLPAARPTHSTTGAQPSAPRPMLPSITSGFPSSVSSRIHSPTHVVDHIFGGQPRAATPLRYLTGEYCESRAPGESGTRFIRVKAFKRHRWHITPHLLSSQERTPRSRAGDTTSYNWMTYSILIFHPASSSSLKASPSDPISSVSKSFRSTVTEPSRFQRTE